MEKLQSFMQPTHTEHEEGSILDAADAWTWISFRAILKCLDVEAMRGPFVAAHREKEDEKAPFIVRLWLWVSTAGAWGFRRCSKKSTA
jgi:hypothetical protein